jgi:hypothetical protein
MRELAGSVWLLVKRVMTGAVVGVTISDRFEWCHFFFCIFAVTLQLGMLWLALFY